MSTLLTPIVTQLELDRDRFKGLINGTETETVDLEGRTEKSIAGQVKKRIDDMSISLSDAVDNAQSASSDSIGAKIAAEAARDTAVSAKSDAKSATVTAEGARDQAKSYKNSTEDYYNNVNSMYPNIIDAKNTTQTARDQAQDAKVSAETYSDDADASATTAASAKNDAQDAASQTSNYLSQVQTIKGEVDDIAGDLIDNVTNVDLVYPPSKIYPTEKTIIDTSDDTIFTSTVPIVLTDKANFIKRTYQIQVYDDSLEEWTSFKSFAGMSFIVNSGEFDNTKDYRWNVQDSIELKDKGTPSVIKSPTTKWESISFSQNPSATRHNYVKIEKPTVSVDNMTISGDLFSSPDGATFLNSTVMIRNVVDGMVVYTNTTTSESGHKVPTGILNPFMEYECSIRYTGTESGNTTFSSWSDFVSLSPHSQTEYKSSDSIDINHEDAVLFNVDGTMNPTVTITEPIDENFYEITVFVNGNGSVVWPASIVWGSGSEPTIGSSFTLIKLFWVGSQWVGKLEASA